MFSERAHAAMNASAVAIGRPRASAAFEICAYERHTCKLDGTIANRRRWVASSAIRRGPQSFLYTPRYISATVIKEIIGAQPNNSRSYAWAKVCRFRR